LVQELFNNDEKLRLPHFFHKNKAISELFKNLTTFQLMIQIPKTKLLWKLHLLCQQVLILEINFDHI